LSSTGRGQIGKSLLSFIIFCSISAFNLIEDHESFWLNFSCLTTRPGFNKFLGPPLNRKVQERQLLMEEYTVHDHRSLLSVPRDLELGSSS
jgi:hypothetical protein